MMSTNQVTRTPSEIASRVLLTMARPGGELWLFSFDPRDLADAIEVSQEIAVKLQSMAKCSEAMEILWSRTKPILDARAAALAIEELLT